MRLDRLFAASALLVAGLVSVYGHLAWLETESRVLDAAEAQGRALLESVAAGIQSSLDASRAVDGLLATRLSDLAVQLDTELAESRSPQDEILERFIRTHGLRGAVTLDASLEVRAVADQSARGTRPAADGPFEPARVARLEAEALARRARVAGLIDRDRVVLGFGDSPLGSRTEFLVSARAPRSGGYVLLRLDAAELEGFQEQAGVGLLLERAAGAAGIDYLVIESDEGVVLAAADPADVGRTLPDPTSGWQVVDGASPAVLDVVLSAPWEGSPQGRLRVGLAAEPVRDVLAGARRNILILTLLVAVAGAGGLLLIAHRERRNQERQDALRRELELRERFASLGRLAGGVAHEIRSPLNALSMAAQRLRREVKTADDDAQARLEELQAAIGSSVGRLNATVEEFLALGTGADGGAPVEKERVDVAALVRAVVSREAPSAQAEGADDLLINADPRLLEKALANLVRNGEQAAPGTVSIAWRRSARDVTITVSDGGPGIAPEDLDAVFEPFFTRRAGGTGLGLTIARDAVVRQGGTLTVESPSCGGTLFVVTLTT